MDIGLLNILSSLDSATALMATLAAPLAVFLDSSSDEGMELGLLLLLSGPAFFLFTYLRYRNTDKRHYHEVETPAEMSNLQQYDNLVEHLTRQRSSQIDGANDSMVTGSLANRSTSGGGNLADKILDGFSDGEVIGNGKMAGYVVKQIRK